MRQQFTERKFILGKISLIKTLTYRELIICSSKQLLDQEFELILKTITLNGYPFNLVQRKIKNTIDQYQKTTNQDKRLFTLLISVQIT